MADKCQSYFRIVYYYNTAFMNILNLLLFFYFPLSFKFEFNL